MLPAPSQHPAPELLPRTPQPAQFRAWMPFLEGRSCSQCLTGIWALQKDSLLKSCSGQDGSHTTWNCWDGRHRSLKTPQHPSPTEPFWENLWLQLPWG